ncbi:hypothetical protein PFICI_01719 [Pestalotiopsis fici W106-1]|uniref:Heterokaryon incompatibility domain-containing protein n=1 Tax=Pestalotiopsis fici (strain W106-1 / CGMCC3.15140) TaxID=1229662 RepID=W3XRN8_PESFW|nr:uncharacterized protein PFICI_01719 [Pestalotiopsis fici W106-1]ETS87891.1 hypothetical protein PFICI_01719 [Pestalotiopsis fici W106-1]
MDKSQLYQSLDLLKKEIRLLEVLPGPSDTALHGRLLHTSLQDPVPYETISYCWGDASVRGTLMIDEFEFDAPLSSLTVLKCMRRPDAPRRLWVDAICINQDDIDERGSQVALMSQIYRQARTNLVYLGEEDEMTRRGLKCIRELLQEISDKTIGFSRFHRLMRSFQSDLRRDSNLTMNCTLDEAGVLSLFDRPWFERLWVVQEAVLAPTSICFYGPSLTVGLVELLRAARWITYNRASISREMHDNENLNNAVDLWSLVDNKSTAGSGTSIEPPNDPDLSALLLLARHRLSTEAKDKVFGVLGLLSQQTDASEDGPDTSLLETDYKKSQGRVFCDAIRYAIQELNSLRILEYVNHAIEPNVSSLGDFASWVPRFDLPINEEVEAEVLPPIFAADNDDGVNREDMEIDLARPTMLSLMGYWISTIAETSDVFSSEIMKDTSKLVALLQKLPVMVRGAHAADLRMWGGDNTGIENGFSLMLAATLMGGNWNNQPVEDDDVEAFRTFLEALMAGSWTYDPNDPQWQCLESACRNRRFFVGKDLGFIGLGPSCMRPGDVVSILYGGSVPFILRNITEDMDAIPDYLMLGAAYVYGVMDGGYVRSAEELEAEIISFNTV